MVFRNLNELKKLKNYHVSLHRKQTKKKTIYNLIYKIVDLWKLETNIQKIKRFLEFLIFKAMTFEKDEFLLFTRLIERFKSIFSLVYAIGGFNVLIKQHEFKN